MTSPFRIWMTGCFAVVVAAVSADAANGAERQARGRGAADSRASRYGAAETVLRLESCAARHGFTVFARLASGGSADGTASIIVFESARGGTPVWMDGPASQPHLPLAVRVRGTAGGASEVWFIRPDFDDLPADLARDLTELPALLDDALA